MIVLIKSFIFSINLFKNWLLDRKEGMAVGK